MAVKPAHHLERRIKMPMYSITVWASYETIVEADNQAEAEEIAVDECPFSECDYCETTEIE